MVRRSRWSSSVHGAPCCASVIAGVAFPVPLMPADPVDVQQFSRELVAEFDGHSEVTGVFDVALAVGLRAVPGSVAVSGDVVDPFDVVGHLLGGAGGHLVEVGRVGLRDRPGQDRVKLARAPSSRRAGVRRRSGVWLLR